MNAIQITEQIDLVVSRLERSGDTIAVGLIKALMAEVAARDEALLNLVADNEIEEDADEDGVAHTIKCGTGSFDSFLKAFGHRPVVAYDPGAPDPEDAQVYLSALDFLFLRIENEGLTEAMVREGNYQTLQIPVPGNPKAVYWRQRFDPGPEASP